MKSGSILLLIGTLFVWTCCSLNCEKPWTLMHRNCVLYEKTEKMSWYDAQAKCESFGASLITVNSFREKFELQKGLARRIKKPNEEYWWVGLHQNRSQAKWVWQDGNFLNLRSNPWGPGEPDNRGGNELCADFHFTGKLSDKDCGERKPFICERIKITPAPKQTQTTTFSKPLTTLVSTTTSTKLFSTKQQKEKTTSTSIETTTQVPSPTKEIVTERSTTTTMSTIKSTSRNTNIMTKTTTVISTDDNSIIKDECPSVVVYGIQWPETYVSSLVKRPCPNTSGFAYWTCRLTLGWVAEPDLSQCSSTSIQRISKMVDSLSDRNILTTEDVLSVAANLTESIVSSNEMSASDISTSTSILHQIARGQSMTVRETETILKEVVKAGTYLFSKTETSKNINTNDKERAASDLLFVIENTTRTMVDSVKSTGTINTKTDKINLYIHILNGSDAPLDLEYNGQDDGISFTIPYASLKHHTKDGVIKAVFMTHYDLGNILQTNEDSDDIEVASNIVTASLGKEKTVKLSNPVVFTMQLSRTFGKTSQPLCSFWNFSKGDYGQWSQEGCSFTNGNSTHVTCQCNHLTNFAVLMDVSGVKLTYAHTQFLRYITYIGCIISITCLALSWITFQCIRSLDCERNSIHKNLVFCLFAAELIFVVGIDRTSNRVSCAAIALLLHFFFLSSFTWMFLEGVHIVIQLKQVFDTAKQNMKYYYFTGYGIPITIVGVTAGIDFKAYGTSDYCWLTTDEWFVWSFTGPIALILIINTVVLMYALSMVCRHSSYIFPQDKKQQSNFRAWIQGALAIEVLLGSTWVFGYFFINEATVVMAYIFTVLNSIQGLFIFIFHCLLNKKIRFEYKKMAHVRHNSQSSTKSTVSFKKKDGSYEMYVSN